MIIYFTISRIASIIFRYFFLLFNGDKQEQREMSGRSTGLLLLPRALARAPRYAVNYFASMAGNVSVSAEETPNPETLKFSVYGLQGSSEIVSGSSIELDRHGDIKLDLKLSDDAEELRQVLFNDSRVSAVTLGPDFISVRKRPIDDWGDDFVGMLEQSILCWLTSNWSGVAVNEDTERADAKVEDEVDEIVDFIKSLLDTRVRPTLHVDGGDVEFVSFDLDTGL